MNNKCCILIAGLEGSGHHMMSHVIPRDIKKHYNPPFPISGGFRTISFPHGHERNPYMRPDMVALSKNAIRYMVDLRIVLLLRNPIECVWSAVRRGFSPVDEQLNIVDINLKFFEEQVPNISNDQILPLLYWDVVNGNQSKMREVEQFLDIPSDNMLWDKVHHPTNTMPDDVRNKILDYFSERSYNIENEVFKYSFSNNEEVFECKYQK